jgi:hypothetical protein
MRSRLLSKLTKLASNTSAGRATNSNSGVMGCRKHGNCRSAHLPTVGMANDKRQCLRLAAWETGLTRAILLTNVCKRQHSSVLCGVETSAMQTWSRTGSNGPLQICWVCVVVRSGFGEICLPTPPTAGSDRLLWVPVSARRRCLRRPDWPLLHVASRTYDEGFACTSEHFPYFFCKPEPQRQQLPKPAHHLRARGMVKELAARRMHSTELTIINLQYKHVA